MCGLPWLKWPTHGFQNELQVALIPGTEEIQAFTAQRPTEALAYGVCFWRPHRCLQHSHTHSGHFLVQFSGKDAVLVMEDESIRMITG
jgi:hypothetical protein